MKKYAIFALFCLILSILNAKEVILNEFVIAENAFVRATSSTNNTAVFLNLSNHSTKDATIIGVASNVATKAELHTSKKEGVKITMQKLEEITIKPHNTHEFKPGGDHIMLMGLQKQLKEGDYINLIFYFKDGSQLIIDEIPVKSIMKH